MIFDYFSTRCSLKIILLLPLICTSAAPFPNETDLAKKSRFLESPAVAKIVLPLRKPHEDWQGAQHRIKNDPIAKSWVLRREEWVRQWMTKRPDQARYIPGWGHDYVDPLSGKPLEWHFDDPEPAQTPDKAKLHGAWVYFVRDTNIAVAKEAAQLFRLLDSEELKDFAALQLDFYAENYSKWPEQNFRGSSRMLGQSLDEAVAAFNLLETARLIGPYVGLERREKWRRDLFKPMMDKLIKSNRGTNNVSVWQVSATAALASEIGDDGAQHFALNGKNGINEILDRGLLEDGSWFEPSFRYTAYTIQALGSLFLWTELTNPDPSLKLIKHITQGMLATLVRQRFADGTLPSMGDTANGTRALDPALLDVTQRTLPIRAGRLPLTWGALIDPVPSLNVPPVEEGNILMPGEQAALLRNGNWETFFHYGQREASHAQADALSYELRYKGQLIASAPGMAPYGSRLFLHYLRLGPAHNAPLINGIGQSQFAAGVLISHSNNEITAKQNDYAVKSDVVRSLNVSKTVFTDVTRFTKRAGEASTGIAFHTECIVSDEGFMPEDAPLKLEEFWKNTRRAYVASSINMILDCASQRFILAFAADKPGTLYISDEPDGSGAQARHAIVLLTDGAHSITTTVRPDR
jgi:hypothetical protein